MSTTLINLLPNSDFTSGWTVNANCTIEFSTEQHLIGNKSLKLTSTNTSSTESLVNNSTNIPLIKGHKYYVRCNIYVPNSMITSGMQCYTPIAEPLFGNLYKSGSTSQKLESTDINKWVQLSCINTRDNWDSGNYPFRFDVENIVSPNYVYLDGAMFIDLTACYGSGKEPDKATLDNIPYFSDKKVINQEGVWLKVNNKWVCVRPYYG
jgi:hypothetical protein